MANQLSFIKNNLLINRAKFYFFYDYDIKITFKDSHEEYFFFYAITLI